MKGLLEYLKNFPLWLLLERLLTFYKKHGASGTIERFLVIPIRIIRGRSVVFYVDLNTIERTDNIEQNVIEEKKGEGDLSEMDMKRLIYLRGDKVIKKIMKKRFSEGGVLWLLKQHGKIASICWTTTGMTLQKFPLPLGRDDVHYFDVETFPEFKGKGLAPLLINKTLENFKSQGLFRAYIDVKIWNKTSLSFVGKTLFKEFGTARMLKIFNKNIAIWS
jgi:GNAT superfamily N-acetyltransferase